MIDRFLHEGLASRILFGSGTVAKVRDEAIRLNMTRALVLTTPEQMHQGHVIEALLGDTCAGVFTGARMHTPVDVTQKAVDAVRATFADGIVVIGGGSTTGLGKAIALRTDLPQIVVPTTYAGSEVTPILGETEDGVKKTQRSLKVLPETVIYDVDLTLGLPIGMTVTSGLNAIAHAAEALYAEDVSPIMLLTAEEGIRALVDALPRIVANPGDVAARHDALYGAWLCGICLGSVGMALHHKLCHTLGGSLDLPHAETHSVILPHALAYNLPTASEAGRRMARATGWEDPAAGLHDFAARIGAPLSLRQLGMAEAEVRRMADMAVENPYRNPRPVERDAIARLIGRAWRGEAPQRD